MALGWRPLLAILSLAFFMLGMVGCELDECTDDPTTEENECSDIFVPGLSGGEVEVEGEESTEEVEEVEEEVDCSGDGYCNFQCVDVNGTPQDIDCNPNVPNKAPSGQKTELCDCDYWGFVCEAATPCSMKKCDCDPDCNDPEGLMTPCGAGDFHCDTYCPEDVDPDCLNKTKSEGNGKYCGGGGGGGSEEESDEGGDPGCDQNPGICDAEAGTANACSGDPDCDDFTNACEGDGVCDTKCTGGADPDCEEGGDDDEDGA